MKVRKQRVGAWTVEIESARSARSGDVVGMPGWSAEVDGRVTVLASGPLGLYVGTNRGVVSRLETVTGRRCGKHELGVPIESIGVAGKRVIVNGDVTLLAGSLRAPKPKK